MGRAAAGGTGPAGRLLLGRAGQGWVLSRPEQALLVIGPPRSGKTSAVVVPNVLVADGPVVSTSTKPDVLCASLAVRGQRGRCWMYDPTGQTAPPEGVEPLRWSPLAGAERWDTAAKTAATLVGTSRMANPQFAYWEERAEALLAPLLHSAAMGGYEMPTVCRWVNRREMEPAIEVLETAGSQEALEVLDGLRQGSHRELSSFWSTAASALSAYRTAAARATTVEPNFDPSAFVQSTDTVYICAPGSHQAIVAPLVSGLVEQVTLARYQLARRPPGTVAKLPPVLLALDEVANIAPLPDLPAMVSEGGGQGVLVLACFQDLSQARGRWSHAAAGFMSLFGAKLVLSGVGDVSTLSAVSELCGRHEVVVRSTQRHGLRTTRGWSSRDEPRVTAEEIRRGRPGAALLIEAGEPACWLELVGPAPRRLEPRARAAGGLDPGLGR